MKEQFKKRKSRPEFSERSDAPRPKEGGWGPPRARSYPSEGARFEGSEDRPRRNTFRREGAVGGWSRSFQRGAPGGDRPWQGNREGGPRSEGGYRSEGGHRGEGGGDYAPRYNKDRAPGGTRPSRPPFGDRPQQAPAQQKVVPAAALKEGIAAANRGLAKVMEQFGRGIEGDYDISALEASVSFDAQGRFLGFGEGGAASFTITLTPLDAESVVRGELEDEPSDEDESDDADVSGASGISSLSKPSVASLPAFDEGEHEDSIVMESDDDEEADEDGNEESEDFEFDSEDGDFDTEDEPGHSDETDSEAVVAEDSAKKAKAAPNADARVED